MSWQFLAIFIFHTHEKPLSNTHAQWLAMRDTKHFFGMFCFFEHLSFAKVGVGSSSKLADGAAASVLASASMVTTAIMMIMMMMMIMMIIMMMVWCWFWISRFPNLASSLWLESWVTGTLRWNQWIGQLLRPLGCDRCFRGISYSLDLGRCFVWRFFFGLIFGYLILQNLCRHGVTPADIALWEINEAFAVVVIGTVWNTLCKQTTNL